MKLTKMQTVLRLSICAAMLSGNLTAFAQQQGGAAPSGRGFATGAAFKPVSAVSQMDFRLQPGTQLNFDPNKGFARDNWGIQRTETVRPAPASILSSYVAPAATRSNPTPAVSAKAASGRSNLGLLDRAAINIRRVRNGAGPSGWGNAAGTLQVIGGVFDRSQARRGARLFSFADSAGDGAGEAVPAGKGSGSSSNPPGNNPEDEYAADPAFSRFSPHRIERQTDPLSELSDRTLLVTGHLNRSVEARVRYDGKNGSPTIGKFFVATRVFFRDKDFSLERPLSQKELKGLHQALDHYLSLERLLIPRDIMFYQEFRTHLIVARADSILGELDKRIREAGVAGADIDVLESYPPVISISILPKDFQKIADLFEYRTDGGAFYQGLRVSVSADYSEGPVDLLLPLLIFNPTAPVTVDRGQRSLFSNAVARHSKVIFQALAAHYGISAKELITQNAFLHVTKATALSRANPPVVIGASYQVEVVRNIPKKLTVPDPNKPLKGTEVAGYLIADVTENGKSLSIHVADPVTLEVAPPFGGDGETFTRNLIARLSEKYGFSFTDQKTFSRIGRIRILGLVPQDNKQSLRDDKPFGIRVYDGSGKFNEREEALDTPGSSEKGIGLAAVILPAAAMLAVLAFASPILKTGLWAIDGATAGGIVGAIFGLWYSDRKSSGGGDGLAFVGLLLSAAVWGAVGAVAGAIGGSLLAAHFAAKAVPLGMMVAGAPVAAAILPVGSWIAATATPLNIWILSLLTAAIPTLYAIRRFGRAKYISTVALVYLAGFAFLPLLSSLGPTGPWTSVLGAGLFMLSSSLVFRSYGSLNVAQRTFSASALSVAIGYLVGSIPFMVAAAGGWGLSTLWAAVATRVVFAFMIFMAFYGLGLLAAMIESPPS